MRYFRRSRRIEYRLKRINMGEHSIFQGKALRRIHKRIYRRNKKRGGKGSNHDGNKQQQMQQRPSKPLPRIQINAEKNRLDKKRKGLHKQRKSNRLSGNPHKCRP
ncbi:hypothetical protein D3C77_660940 [compost metagenome]